MGPLKQINKKKSLLQIDKNKNMPLLSFIKIKAVLYRQYYTKCTKIKQQYRFEVPTFKHKHSTAHFVMQGLTQKHNINGLKIKKRCVSPCVYCIAVTFSPPSVGEGLLPAEGSTERSPFVTREHRTNIPSNVIFYLWGETSPGVTPGLFFSFLFFSLCCL